MSIPHKIIPISFDLQEVLQEKYFIQTRSGTEKEGITVGIYMDMINPCHPI